MRPRSSPISLRALFSTLVPTSSALLRPAPRPREGAFLPLLVAVLFLGGYAALIIGFSGRHLQGDTFVLPHVLEKSGRIQSIQGTFDTNLHAAYATGLLDAQPGSMPPGAAVDLYLFDGKTSLPLRSKSGSEVCNPCSFPLDGSHRKLSLIVNNLITAAGGFSQPAVDAFGLLDVRGDADGAALQGFVVNSHTGPRDLSVFGFQPDPLRGPGIDSKRTLVFPHLLEASGRITNTQFTFDTSIIAVYSGGILDGSRPRGAVLHLRLFDASTGEPLVTGTGQAVCNPCTFQFDAAVRKLGISLEELIEAAGGFQGKAAVEAFATAVIEGDVDRLSLQGFVVNSHTGPLDLSVFGFEPQEIRAPTGDTRRTLMIPHILESRGRITNTQFTFDTSIHAAYTGGLAGENPGAAPPGASLDLYLFDETTGEPMQSAGGTAVCNPCSFKLDGTRRKQDIVIDDLVTAAGGFSRPVSQGFAAIVIQGDVDNVNLQGFVVNAHTGPLDLSVFGFEPQEIRNPTGDTRRTLVIPHILETSGRITNTQFTFDTSIFAAYSGGLLGGTPGGAPPGAALDFYLFDEATGQPMRSAAGTAVCNPCTFQLDAATRKQGIRLEELITAAGGFPAEVVLGFGVLVLRGDVDSVHLQGFVVNSHTGPFDVSLHGFEPQPVSLPAAPPPISFVSGDVNGDGDQDISDPVAILGFLFLGDTVLDCLLAADVNGTNDVDIADAVYLLGALFLGFDLPVGPYPRCGPDPLARTLSCAVFKPCPAK